MKRLALILTSLTLTLTFSGCANPTPAQQAMLERAGSVVLDAAAHRVAAEIAK